MMAKQAPAARGESRQCRVFRVPLKRDGWLMSFSWAVDFVVIGLSVRLVEDHHKAQREDFDHGRSVFR